MLQTTTKQGNEKHIIFSSALFLGYNFCLQAGA